jgi:hypothetical protein
MRSDSSSTDLFSATIVFSRRHGETIFRSAIYFFCSFI